MIDVDHETERHLVWRQYLLTVAGLGVLLWFAVPDKLLFALLLPGLAAVVGYRSWAVERFSPTLAQHYARAVVTGAASEMMSAFAGDQWLRETWSRHGAPLGRLLAAPAPVLATAAASLRRDNFAPSRLAEPAHTVNRVVAVVLGGLAGTALARGDLTWPIWVAAVLFGVSALVVRRYNRGRQAWVSDSMRSNTRAELAALLDPPWRERRSAVVAELSRLADLAEGQAAARTGPELRTLNLLLLAGVAAGLIVGAAVPVI